LVVVVKVRFWIADESEVVCNNLCLKMS
jgi:hypothetical protein